MKTCCWVTKPATPETPAEYCGIKTRYTIQLDVDSGTRVRVYDRLCHYHKQADERAAASQQEETEGE